MCPFRLDPVGFEVRAGLGTPAEGGRIGRGVRVDLGRFGLCRLEAGAPEAASRVVPLLDEPVADGVSVDRPRDGPRELVGVRDRLRDLEAGEPLAGERHERLVFESALRFAGVVAVLAFGLVRRRAVDGQFVTIRDLDERRHALAPLVVVDPDDGDVFDRGVFRENAGHLTRFDVLTAREDPVVEPVEHVQVSVLVDPSHVAGVEPVRSERRAGRLRSEVSRGYRRAVHDDLARLARRHGRSVLVDDGDVGPEERPTDRADSPARPLRSGRRHLRGRLGHPVRRVDRDRVVPTALDQLVRRGCPAEQDDAQRLGEGSSPVEHPFEHRRNERDAGHVVPVDVVCGSARVESLAEHERRAVQRRPVHRGEPAHVMERERDEPAVVGVDAEPERGGDPGGVHVARGERDRLCRAGRPGGEKHAQPVVERPVGRVDRRRLRAVDGGDRVVARLVDGEDGNLVARRERLRLRRFGTDDDVEVGSLDALAQLPRREPLAERDERRADAHHRVDHADGADVRRREDADPVVVTDAVCGEPPGRLRDEPVEVGVRPGFSVLRTHQRHLVRRGDDPV